MGTYLPIVKEIMSNLLRIGERLKEERERLGINQTDFATLGESSRKTQFNYETGERVPDAAYLSSIAEAGADVLYILTGTRSATMQSISPRQRALLDNYEHSDDQGKTIIEGTAFTAAQSAQVKKVRIYGK